MTADQVCRTMSTQGWSSRQLVGLTPRSRGCESHPLRPTPAAARNAHASRTPGTWPVHAARGPFPELPSEVRSRDGFGGARWTPRQGRSRLEMMLGASGPGQHARLGSRADWKVQVAPSLEMKSRPRVRPIRDGGDEGQAITRSAPPSFSIARTSPSRSGSAPWCAPDGPRRGVAG